MTARLEPLSLRRHPERTGPGTNLSLHFLPRMIEWSNLTSPLPQPNRNLLRGRLRGLESSQGLEAKMLGYLYPMGMAEMVQHKPSLVRKLKRNPRHGRSSNPPILVQIDAGKRSTFHLALLPLEEIISWTWTLALYDPRPSRLHLALSPTPPRCHPPQNMALLNYPPPPQHPPPMRKWTRIQIPLTTRRAGQRLK